MKNVICYVSILAVIVLLTGFLFSNCSGDDESPSSTATVSFDLGYNNAPAVTAIKVDKGQAAGINWPADPVQLGFTFDGWYSGNSAYTADTVITGNVSVTAQWSGEEPGLEEQPPEANLADLFSVAGGFPEYLSDSFKVYGLHNPLYTQAFGADPTATVYNDRVYLYMSNDTLLYFPNGNVRYVNQSADEFSYGLGIQGVRMVSSADLVNWTCHGAVNIVGTPNTNPLIEEWSPLITISGVSRSWAPTVDWKMVNGKPKFFMYWGNGGDGIGVITADNPTGPWASPLGNKLLIDRNTPNCSNVDFLFDPGIVIDEHGDGYLFFGGGTSYPPGGGPNNTKNARRVKLNPDMISLAHDPEEWHVPYLFEANEIARIDDIYYYMYSTHSAIAGNTFGLKATQMACMMSYDGPFGEYSNPYGVLDFPRNLLNTQDNNNHGVMFEFKGNAYIAYHTQMLAGAMGIYRYRATHIDKMSINKKGVISPVAVTRKGVDQVGYLNPYVSAEAETIGIQGGVYTRPHPEASNGTVVTSIDTGDWVAVYGVDFGSGAKKFAARVRTPEAADYIGAIELRINPEGDGETGDSANITTSNPARIKGGEVIGRLQIKAKPGEEGKFTTVTIDLDKTVTGVNDLVFVFYSSLGVNPLSIFPENRHKNSFEFDQWQFFK